MYTTGPWEIHTYKDKRIEILHPLINTKDDEYKGTIGGYEVIVGKKNCENGYILNKDNARLIAAAPDMLEALKKVLDIINPYSHIPAQFEANLIIQAAISKAEGGERCQ